MMEDHITPPMQLHEVDKRLRAGIEGVVQKVICKATVEGAGKDLLVRIYLAGLYHGMQHRGGPADG